MSLTAIFRHTQFEPVTKTEMTTGFTEQVKTKGSQSKEAAEGDGGSITSSKKIKKKTLTRHRGGHSCVAGLDQVALLDHGQRDVDRGAN